MGFSSKIKYKKPKIKIRNYWKPNSPNLGCCCYCATFLLHFFSNSARVAASGIVALLLHRYSVQLFVGTSVSTYPHRCHKASLSHAFLSGSVSAQPLRCGCFLPSPLIRYGSGSFTNCTRIS